MAESGPGRNLISLAIKTNWVHLEGRSMTRGGEDTEYKLWGNYNDRGITTSYSIDVGDYEHLRFPVMQLTVHDKARDQALEAFTLLVAR